MRVSYRNETPDDFDQYDIFVDGRSVAAVEADDVQGRAIIELVNIRGEFLHNHDRPTQAVISGTIEFRKPSERRPQTEEDYHHQQRLLNKVTDISRCTSRYAIYVPDDNREGRVCINRGPQRADHPNPPDVEPAHEPVVQTA